MEARGQRLFNGKARCAECHSGTGLTDGSYHNIGVVPGSQPGLFSVTGLPRDRFKIKTPSLRNIARTAPYFHNGSADNLEQVVALYNSGVNLNSGNLDPIIQPLDLSATEQQALVTYLRTFTGQVTQESLPFKATLQTQNQLQFNKGFRLNRGQSKYFGPSNEFRLVMQTDGNLVLYNMSKAIWNTKTVDRNCLSRLSCFAVFQNDGNFVVYHGSGKAKWHTKTARRGQWLQIRSNRPFVRLLDAQKRSIYSSN